MLKLKQVRQLKGLSIRQLSSESGISHRTIEDAERRGDCRLSTAAVLANALDVKIDDLWENEAGE